MKKFLCLLLLCTCVFCSCSICRNPQAEEGAIARFTESYAQACVLYDIVYGAGLPAADGYAFDPNGEAVQYAPVHPDSPYQSIEAIRTQIHALYAESLAQNLCQRAFSNMYGDGTSTAPDPDEDGGEVTPNVTARYKEEGGKLYVNLAYKPLLTSAPMQPDLSSVRAKSSTAMRVTLEVTMHAQDGTVQGYVAAFDLLLEGEVWRFDSPTYIAQNAAALA